MASFVVLTPPDDPEAPERAEIIRDGFAWFALIIPVFWLLWHRLWFSAALMLLASVGVVLGMDTFPDWTAAFFTAAVLLSIYVALEGNGLRIARRERQDWQVDAIIEAPNGATAEAIYLAELGHTPKRKVPPPPSRGWTVQPDTKTAPADKGPALGLLDINGKH